MKQAYTGGKRRRALKEPYWIIEHETRGGFMEWVESEKHWPELRPRFQYSGSRSESKIYYSVEAARAELAKIHQARSPGVRKAYILEMGRGPNGFYARVWQGARV